MPGSFPKSPKKQSATHNRSHGNPPKMRRDTSEKRVHTTANLPNKKRSAAYDLLVDPRPIKYVIATVEDSETCQYVRERLALYQEEDEQKRNLAEFENAREALEATVPQMDGYSKVGPHDH